jgi:hypothetical protein
MSGCFPALRAAVRMHKTEQLKAHHAQVQIQNCNRHYPLIADPVTSQVSGRTTRGMRHKGFLH